jgi:ribose transport system ATP-binding protein
MLLEMKNIVKDFGAVKALSDVDLTVGAGEIHGLLGENGAGKTTLMNVLSGTFPPTSGKIFIGGHEVVGMTPKKSKEMKIRFIHQELNLCNDLRVYENMFLGEELLKKGMIDKKEEIRQAAEVLTRMKVNIDAKALVGELETAQKQIVEIAKALLFKSELIIMDEPTTSLNNREIDNLFAIMKELKSQGVSFIYISHKMPELFTICDKYTVLRDGVFIETGFFKDIDETRATELLIGRTFAHSNLKDENANYISPEVFMEVSNLSGHTFKNVSFSLRKGEILAFTGLQGAGTTELASALFGATDKTSGEIKIKGETLRAHHIKSVMKHGVAMVPRNRKERGILPHLSIRDNHSIAYFTIKHNKLLIDKNEEKNRFAINLGKMNIRIGSETDPITALSGGNQQKVIIGRWLATESEIFIMENPTQGIDVGAKYEIYKLIIELAKQGKSIIVFSTEFPEIHHIADQCIVMYKGEINGELSRAQMTEANVMLLSTGAKLGGLDGKV